VPARWNSGRWVIISATVSPGGRPGSPAWRRSGAPGRGGDHHVAAVRRAGAQRDLSRVPGRRVGSGAGAEQQCVNPLSGHGRASLRLPPGHAGRCWRSHTPGRRAGWCRSVTPVSLTMPDPGVLTVCWRCRGRSRAHGDLQRAGADCHPVAWDGRIAARGPGEPEYPAAVARAGRGRRVGGQRMLVSSPVTAGHGQVSAAAEGEVARAGTVPPHLAGGRALAVTVCWAGQILMIGAGRVTRRGTHTELPAAPGPGRRAGPRSSPPARNRLHDG